MKKQFATVFAATAVLGVTSAFAANPFSDITPDSWAYQAVSQLAVTGIVNGYPDGTFKGQNNITRYEMAQMVAKAMANQDRANAEQQAMINRLADEFSNELNNLGVRVSKLEDRVGNVKVTGDLRLRTQGSDDRGVFKDGAKSLTDARARVQFNANVNDKTEAVVRVKGEYEFGDGSENNSSQAKIDRAYVNHKFNENNSLKAGRFNQVIGGGLMYDDSFDGAQLNLGNDKIQLQGAYGYMVDGAASTNEKSDNSSVSYVGLKGKIGQDSTLGGFYARMSSGDLEHNGVTQAFDNQNVYGFNADFNKDKVWVGGEWLKASNVSDSTAWTAGIGYGNYDISKQGTWDIKGQYFNQKANAPIVSSTWDQAYDLTNTSSGYKGYMATVDYAVQDNVGLSAGYGFNSKDQSGNDLSDFYRAELNYKF
ncbi:MAG: S-layer homology domain-containing protein [Veillonella caviae]|uniref:S-layer homology domain-containing protein n=1 Tax=Veillonella caviae TaxID=248316 RepID=UPI002A91D4BE|nr:S-layer homology domain-containing protein [Veillonella caviae]MDY5481982.1 S-layer homology domain-containing protein [Veillonella caviae]